ncbi:hypothetical protein [Kitasatospora sp. McL0602]|uniref:hypothetical protein n=1 Tax=Kitasatospora sp. McL0602 TaxID=3439530 RepID=UPI003F89C37D
MRSPIRYALTTTALALALTACGSSGSAGSAGSMSGDMPGMSHGATATTMAGAGDGLAAEQGGYRLEPLSGELPAGAAADFRFRIAAPDGKPLTAFETEQTKQLHFYAVRSDLSGFQHLHPTTTGDGTWTAALAALQPGSWRLYTQFTPASGPGRGTTMVLSRAVTVPGQAAAVPLPAASGSTTADGYTVTVEGSPKAGQAGELKVGFAKDGKPVTDLEPYLDTYAHLTAFHAGDQAFAHLHPGTPVNGTTGGGPTLPFHAELSQPGDWRLFLQFRTGGVLHTAALTLKVG